MSDARTHHVCACVCVCVWMLEALTACAIVAAWRGGEGHIMTKTFYFLMCRCSVAVRALGGANCDANSGACDVISILYTVVCADGDSVAWKCDGSWTRHWSEFVVGCSVRNVMVLQGAGCTMLLCLAAMWKVADNCFFVFSSIHSMCSPFSVSAGVLTMLPLNALGCLAAAMPWREQSLVSSSVSLGGKPGYLTASCFLPCVRYIQL